MSKQRNLDPELRAWLKAGDPLEHDPPLSETEVAILRQRVLSRYSARQKNRGWFMVPVLAGIAIIVFSFLLVFKDPSPESPVDPLFTLNDLPGDQQRLVHFQTPRGTRIIWVLKSSSASFPNSDADPLP